MAAPKDPIKYQEWIEKLSGREPPNKNVQVGHCLNCGKEFHFPLSRKGLRKYCSTECLLDAHRVIVRCKNCGEEFLAPKSRAGRVAFCSGKCYGSHREQHPEQYPPPPLRGRSIEVECGYCDITFRVCSARRNTVRFCSKKCHGKYVRSHPELYGGSNHWNWKGGRTGEIRLLRQSEEYKEWRDAVFRRDNWTCQNPECGYKGHKIVAHHIKNFEEYPEFRYDVDNGQTLCRACHKKLHYNIGEETRFEKGQVPWNKLPILWERETKDEGRILEKVQAKQGT